MVTGDLMRVTILMLRVATLFAVEPRKTLWNYAVAKRLKLSPTTTVSVLKRLEQEGWLTAEDERADSVNVGRARRRMYRITDLGREQTMIALQDLQL